MNADEMADEWVRLRRSVLPEEHQRAAWMEMPDEAWAAVLERHPDMANWVAHAKRSPRDIVARLARHPDWRVRAAVAAQRRLDPAIRAELAQDPHEIVRRRAGRFLEVDGL
ncbi:MAG: hypothetical protein JO246_14815 [Frankiaceae bacterium]|nr:hypothetical protein [Frankiaceae bacterium]MBV9869057.1 hypothetical protein [Frankiaceae bacterium]